VEEKIAEFNRLFSELKQNRTSVNIYSRKSTIEKVPSGDGEVRSFAKEIGSAETLETDFEVVEQ
jgi:hypothetical protein